MKDFIEQQITTAVRKLLTGRVNEILENWEFLVPVIEFGNIGSGYATAPVINLSSCERTEKERIIRLDAYSLDYAVVLWQYGIARYFMPAWRNGRRSRLKIYHTQVCVSSSLTAGNTVILCIVLNLLQNLFCRIIQYAMKNRLEY